jgi:predicted transcriptional regulator
VEQTNIDTSRNDTDESLPKALTILVVLNELTKAGQIKITYRELGEYFKQDAEFISHTCSRVMNFLLRNKLIIKEKETFSKNIRVSITFLGREFLRNNKSGHFEQLIQEKYTGYMNHGLSIDPESDMEFSFLLQNAKSIKLGGVSAGRFLDYIVKRIHCTDPQDLFHHDCHIQILLYKWGGNLEAYPELKPTLEYYANYPDFTHYFGRKATGTQYQVDHLNQAPKKLEFQISSEFLAEPKIITVTIDLVVTDRFLYHTFMIIENDLGIDTEKVLQIGLVTFDDRTHRDPSNTKFLHPHFILKSANSPDDAKIIEFYEKYFDKVWRLNNPVCYQWPFTISLTPVAAQNLSHISPPTANMADKKSRLQFILKQIAYGTHDGLYSRTYGELQELLKIDPKKKYFSHDNRTWIARLEELNLIVKKTQGKNVEVNLTFLGRDFLRYLSKKESSRVQKYEGIFSGEFWNLTKVHMYPNRKKTLDFDALFQNAEEIDVCSISGNHFIRYLWDAKDVNHPAHGIWERRPKIRLVVLNPDFFDKRLELHTFDNFGLREEFTTYYPQFGQETKFENPYYLSKLFAEYNSSEDAEVSKKPSRKKSAKKTGEFSTLSGVNKVAPTFSNNSNNTEQIQAEKDKIEPRLSIKYLDYFPLFSYLMSKDRNGTRVMQIEMYSPGSTNLERPLLVLKDYEADIPKFNRRDSDEYKVMQYFETYFNQYYRDGKFFNITPKIDLALPLIPDISPDLTEIAVGMDNGSLRVFDMKSKTLIFTDQRHTDRITSVRFSQNGELLVTVGRDRRIQIYNRNATSSYTYFRTIVNVPENIISLKVTNNNLIFARASNDKHLYVWELTPTDEIRKKIEFPDIINYSIYAPNHNWIIVGCNDGKIIYIELNNPTRKFDMNIEAITQNQQVISIYLSPDEKLMILLVKSGEIIIWNLETKETVQRIAKVIDGDVSSSKLFTDGEKLVCMYLGKNRKCIVKEWKCASAAPGRNYRSSGDDSVFIAHYDKEIPIQNVETIGFDHKGECVILTVKDDKRIYGQKIGHLPTPYLWNGEEFDLFTSWEVVPKRNPQISTSVNNNGSSCLLITPQEKTEDLPYRIEPSWKTMMQDQKQKIRIIGFLKSSRPIMISKLARLLGSSTQEVEIFLYDISGAGLVKFTLEPDAIVIDETNLQLLIGLITS